MDLPSSENRLSFRARVFVTSSLVSPFLKIALLISFVLSLVKRQSPSIRVNKMKYSKQLIALLAFWVTCVAEPMLAQGQNKTAEFFGSKAEREFSQLIFRQVNPLFGGLEVFLHAQGELIIRRIRPSNGKGMIEARYQKVISVDEARLPFDALVTNDLLNIPLNVPQDELTLPPPPDWSPSTVILRNSQGETQILNETGIGSEKFRRIVNALIAIEGKNIDVAPAFSGSLEPTFLPDKFQWAKPAFDHSWLAPNKSALSPDTDVEEPTAAEQLEKELQKEQKKKIEERRER